MNKQCSIVQILTASYFIFRPEHPQSHAYHSHWKTMLQLRRNTVWSSAQNIKQFFLNQTSSESYSQIPFISSEVTCQLKTPVKDIFITHKAFLDSNSQTNKTFFTTTKQDVMTLRGTEIKKTSRFTLEGETQQRIMNQSAVGKKKKRRKY